MYFLPRESFSFMDCFATLLELLNNSLNRLCLQTLWAQIMPLAKMLVLQEIPRGVALLNSALQGREGTMAFVLKLAKHVLPTIDCLFPCLRRRRHGQEP